MKVDKNNTVAVSGGFDPVHVGHVRMIRDAANTGGVVIILNTDAWLTRKKGYVFIFFVPNSLGTNFLRLYMVQARFSLDWTRLFILSLMNWLRLILEKTFYSSYWRRFCKTAF